MGLIFSPMRPRQERSVLPFQVGQDKACPDRRERIGGLGEALCRSAAVNRRPAGQAEKLPQGHG